MKIETLDLHGLSLDEAIKKTRLNIEWSIDHGVSVLVINHGKGHHSNRNFSVIKKEIREMLKEDQSIKENGYKVIFGESNFPIALAYNEGQTLLVIKGEENKYLGGKVEQERNKQIYSDEAKKQRKIYKKQRYKKY